MYKKDTVLRANEKGGIPVKIHLTHKFLMFGYYAKMRQLKVCAIHFLNKLIKELGIQAHHLLSKGM